MRKKGLLLWYLILSAFAAFTQDGLGFQEIYKLPIHQAKEKIKIDGIASESTWQTSDMATDFWEKWPNDKVQSKKKNGDQDGIRPGEPVHLRKSDGYQPVCDPDTQKR